MREEETVVDKYPCSHCIQSDAVAGVISAVLGTENMPEVALVFSTLPGITHRFTNLTALSQEVANARIRAGFHYASRPVSALRWGFRFMPTLRSERPERTRSGCQHQTCLQPSTKVNESPACFWRAAMSGSPRRVAGVQKPPFLLSVPPCAKHAATCPSIFEVDP
jgi:hypothetical protein